MVDTQLQPSLISIQVPEREAALELFPGVWQAAENLAAADVRQRQKSLDALLKAGAPRVSPLVAYMLATRIFDPDKGFRGQVVVALADLMQRDVDGTYAAEEVRSQVIRALTYFDDRGLFSLLEVGSEQMELLPHIEKLIKYSPRAGKYLKGIAADRHSSPEVRRIAIQLIGQIGYVDALSELERMRNRIETRQEGQKSMPFAPPGSTSELNLLPDLQKSILSLLQASS